MSDNIGAKIRHFRKEMNISKEKLAEAAGIEPYQLVMIESGKSAPAIATLIRISRAFNVRLGTILDGTEHSGPAVSTSEKVSLNRSESLDRSHDNLHFISLAQQKHDRNMEPYLINVEYRLGDGSKGSSHEGEEFIYVLEGEIEVHYGNETFRLVSGDSIYYDSLVPHIVSTTRPDAKAKLVAVMYTPY